MPQTLIAYLFTRKYGASPETLGIVFFAIGILQAVSFQIAVRLAGRFGLLVTMVFSHLPSNLLLIGVAFAPNLPTAIVLLLFPLRAQPDGRPGTAGVRHRHRRP